MHHWLRGMDRYKRLWDHPSLGK